MHRKIGHSIFVYDKGKYAAQEHKPLGFGITYIKPDGVKTQDIFMVDPNDDRDRIECYYTEHQMIKKYPSMKGVHKKNLPV